MKKWLPKIVGSLLNFIGFFSKKLAARIALRLFSTPLKGKIKDNQKSFLESAYIETLTYNNIPITTYLWKGNYKTILLVHGWESNSFRWRGIVNDLKKEDYNIISLDAPAHGNSGSKIFNAPLYAEFLNIVTKKHQPEIIIGHSVGGMAISFLTNNYNIPSIKKIALLGAPSEFTGIFNQYISIMGFNKKLVIALADYILEHFKFPTTYFSTAKHFENNSIESLIIHDKYDKVIPYSDALLIHKSLTNSTLITTKGLGHSLKHNDVNSHIYNFINK